MRIISGKYKGRRVIAPKRLPVRPTTDQAKEGLFNILQNRLDFEELAVLDLFTGIGSVILEFASRGTTDLTAVDNYYDCVKFVRKISEELEANIHIIRSDAFTFIEKSSRSFDLIFADPPYDMEVKEFEKIIELVFKRNLLSKNGVLIIEHSKHTQLPSHPNFIENRKYGAAMFSFYDNNLKIVE